MSSCGTAISKESCRGEWGTTPHATAPQFGYVTTNLGILGIVVSNVLITNMFLLLKVHISYIE